MDNIDNITGIIKEYITKDYLDKMLRGVYNDIYTLNNKCSTIDNRCIEIGDQLKKTITNISEKKYEELTPDSSSYEKEQFFSENEIDKIWEENRQFFLDHEKEFEQKYPSQYVAVYEGKVIGTNEHLGTLADMIYRSLGNIPFFADQPGVKETIIFDYPLIP